MAVGGRSLASSDERAHLCWRATADHHCRQWPILADPKSGCHLLRNSSDLSNISMCQGLLAVRFCFGQNLPLLAIVAADPPPAAMSSLISAGERSSANGQQLYIFKYPENPVNPV